MARQVFTYCGEAAETVREITENRTEYDFNTLYYNKLYGWYWYRNNKGYFHVIKVERKRKIFTKSAGMIKWYEINDYRLSKDNKVILSESYGYRDTIQEAIQEINDLFTVAENPEIFKNNA